MAESEKYKHALDESSIVAITDARGIIIYVNDNFCKISKYRRDELIGEDHRIINSGHHPKEFIRDLWVTIANGKTWRGDLKNKAKDGSYYWVATTIVPFLNEQGKPYQYLSIRTDITDRKNAEEALKKNEEKYRLLFNSMDEGYCVVELILNDLKKPVDYRFLEVNASFERITGLNNTVGRRVREFLPRYEAHWMEIYEKIIITGEPIRFERYIKRIRQWYDVYAYRFGEPKDFRVAILFKDVTEHKKIEEELLAANKELEAFSYSISHDLRSPLHALDGYIKFLENNYGEASRVEVTNVLEAINHNTQKMRSLIEGLLTFSCLDQKELTNTFLNMNELAAAALRELNMYTSHNAKIRIGDLHNTKGDYALMNQVMINLLSNAVKYSRKVPEPLVDISSRKRGNEIVYSVRDNGAGFDMLYADKLFAVFQRLHSPDEFEGTGVGLAIVQRVINKHGGKVWAQGEKGKGATFNFCLPIK